MPSSAPDASAPVERVDPRVLRTHDRVLAAAVELLREHGAAGLTVEGVAARSGVAKTTIYRQFADRDAIHMAAAEAIGEPIELTVTDDVVADVRVTLGVLAARLRNGDFAAVLATCIDAAERSPRMAVLSMASCDARRSWLARRLQLAHERHELANVHDADLLASQLAGPLFYRRLVSRQPIDAAFVDALTNAVLAPLVSSPSAVGGRARSPG